MAGPLVKDDEGSLESIIGKVADEFLRRQENGECPDIEEYAAVYPQAAPVLRKVLASLRLLDESAASATNGSETLEAAPDTLGDFRIIREIGRGGMGIVYEEQKSLRRRVALKVCRLRPPWTLANCSGSRTSPWLPHNSITPTSCRSTTSAANGA
jgi:serine/threonine-protein kinase